jgi:heme/copper-type cytochrome/quinol oxidase subunit 2
MSKIFHNNLKEPDLKSLKLPWIVESLTALLHVVVIILVLFLIIMGVIVLIVIVILVIIVKASEEGGPAALAEGSVALCHELLLLLNIPAVT